MMEGKGQVREPLRVAIHQPNFNPYLGVIAKYLLADRIVHLDTVQFVKNEFQNRNKVVLNGQPHWLTVPVIHSSQQRMNEVVIDNRRPWRRKHLKTLEQGYSKTPCFSTVFPWLQSVYDFSADLLIDWNLNFLGSLLEFMEITTSATLASDMGAMPNDPDGRLIALCRELGGEVYIAGGGGLDYMNRQDWDRSGIQVQFVQFDHPTYPQGGDPFVPFCGILDCLFRFPPNDVKEFALSGTRLRGWDSE
ncbi:MAG: WbqC family protein [Candidatus Omnitrophica bacterium]|nr:WbqC family protein [Candidatus Omnitrophota bacterium]MCB9766987.1 WbqC family protein [Candidatus Omnitrophota bacterium]MCB9784955.1 WbqC family protein [Candidatus Omnitrophota bacterium]